MARSVRVMHFADTHFGVELYGRLDPDTGLNTRLKDFKQSLLKAIDLALGSRYRPGCVRRGRVQDP